MLLPAWPSRRRPLGAPIRTIFALLTAVILAAGLAVAGYSALWRLQRTSLAGGDAATDQDLRAASELLSARPAPLPAPQRLAARADHIAAVPAAARRPLVVAATAQIRVVGVPPELRDQLGVATFGKNGGGNFHWTPLTSAMSEGADLLVDSPVPVGTAVVVTLAASSAQARHEYLAKAEITAQDGQRAAAVPLVATLGAVDFELAEAPIAEICRGPWRLVRRDDPQWLPMQLASTGLYLHGDRATRLLLGAGTYRLEDPLEPDRHHEFEVPNVARVVLSEQLAEPRAVRR